MQKQTCHKIRFWLVTMRILVHRKIDWMSLKIWEIHKMRLLKTKISWKLCFESKNKMQFHPDSMLQSSKSKVQTMSIARLKAAMIYVHTKSHRRWHARNVDIQALPKSREDAHAGQYWNGLEFSYSSAVVYSASVFTLQCKEADIFRTI